MSKIEVKKKGKIVALFIPQNWQAVLWFPECLQWWRQVHPKSTLLSYEVNNAIEGKKKRDKETEKQIENPKENQKSKSK